MLRRAVDFHSLSVLNKCDFVFFLLGDSPASDFRADVSEHCPIFIGRLNKTYKDRTERSETSTHKIQMTGNHTKERIKHLQHSASLKSRSVILFLAFYWTNIEHHNSVLVIVGYAELLAWLPICSQFLVTKLSSLFKELFYSSWF